MQQVLFWKSEAEAGDVTVGGLFPWRQQRQREVHQPAEPHPRPNRRHTHRAAAPAPSSLCCFCRRRAQLLPSVLSVHLPLCPSRKFRSAGTQRKWVKKKKLLKVKQEEEKWTRVSWVPRWRNTTSSGGSTNDEPWSGCRRTGKMEKERCCLTGSNTGGRESKTEEKMSPPPLLWRQTGVGGGWSPATARAASAASVATAAGHAVPSCRYLPSSETASILQLWSDFLNNNPQ